MTGDEKRAPNRVPCGYGLLGLCCSACLLGPCRLTPFFEGAQAKSLCDRDRDRMAAENLLALSLREALDSMGKLRGILTKKGSLGEVSSLVEETRKLLSLAPGEGSTLSSSLFPEKIFPTLQGVFGEEGFPPRSLMDLLFDAVEASQESSTEVEKLLDQTLQLSLVAHLCQDLYQKITEEGEKGEGGLRAPSLSQKTGRLPAKPSPLTIDWTDLEMAQTPSLSASSRTQRERFLRSRQGGISVLSIEDGRSLFELGRELFSKWGISITDIHPLILVSSRRVNAVLSALALGCSVVSFSPLPIHGSAQVEDFFAKKLKESLGGTYRTLWQDEGVEDFGGEKG